MRIQSVETAFIGLCFVFRKNSPSLPIASIVIPKLGMPLRIRKRTRAGAIFALVLFLIIGLASYSLRDEDCPSGILPLNATPQFDVGEEFCYKTDSYLLSSVENVYEWREEVFTVNRTMQIDDREYYEIVYGLTIHVWESDAIPETVTNITHLLYIDVENGTCVGKTVNPSRYSNEDGLATDIGFFAYWMLGLEEGLRWQIIDEASSKVHRIDVLGMDEVDEMQCFKVRVKELLHGRVNRVRQFWIAADKRIVIKEETDLSSGETVYRDAVSCP